MSTAGGDDPVRPAPARAGRPRAGAGGGVTGEVKSASRLMTIFEHLAKVGSASFPAIVRDLDLPNSSAHELLQTAWTRGFLEHDPVTRSYRLGIRLWQVGQAYSVDSSLVAAAQPLMDALVASTQETVQFARLDGLENVYLAIAESPHPMKLVSSVGARLSAHATGVGKVLLAGLDDERLRALLSGVELRRDTSATITDPETLIAECRQIRVRGFGEDREEYVTGCRCIAMPVHDDSGRVVAAMSVSVPTPRFDEAMSELIHRELRTTVATLETEIFGAPADVAL